jgi:hypothetical protein
VVQVESLAGFFPVLNLRKGEQLSRITVVKILSEAVGVLTKFARTLIFHLTAIRARVVAPELLLIEGRPNQIAFKNLLRPGRTCGAQLDILGDGRVLMHPVSGGCVANSQDTSCYSQRVREQSQRHWGLRSSMNRSTAECTRERSYSRFQIQFHATDTTLQTQAGSTIGWQIRGS